MFFTYIHRKKSDNSVFYVGMGNKSRAGKLSHRPKEHKEIVEKDGVNVEIVAQWDTKQEAWDHEQLLISCFKDMGHSLLNKSLGGPGSFGFSRVATNKERAMISQRMQGNTVWVGRKHKESTKALQRASHLGIPKPPYICLECGKVSGGKSNINQHQKAHSHFGYMEI